MADLASRIVYGSVIAVLFAAAVLAFFVGLGAVRSALGDWRIDTPKAATVLLGGALCLVMSAMAALLSGMALPGVFR